VAETGGTRIKGMRAPKAAASPRKLHAGVYVHDEAYDEEQHDCGPWVGVNSSRVRSIRYDYQNQAVQVHWVGRPDSRGYVYQDVPEDIFNAFIRSNSKGKFVNSTMNGFDYRPMTVDELDAPSNDERRTHGPARPTVSAAGGAAVVGSSRARGGWQNTSDMAKHLGVTQRTIQRRAAAGRVTATKVGGRWMVST